MKLTKEEKKALKELVNLAEQEFDRGCGPGQWDELSDALDVLAPYIYPDYEKGQYHSEK